MATKTADIDVEAEPSAEAEETSSGMNENVAGALAYLFVRDGVTGYTVSVGWNDADRFDMVAARILESFAVQAI